MGRPEKALIEERERRWRTLMRAAQAGDKAAYATLLHEILPQLRRIATRHWLDPDEREDIVQDILISLHGVRHTYDPARPFTPWLVTIARRRIADAGRRKATRSAHETTVRVMPETFPGRETKLEQYNVDIADDIQHAMSCLPKAQREAVELVKVHGLSLLEASEVTGKSVASLKVSIHRAMKSMREVLKG